MLFLEVLFILWVVLYIQWTHRSDHSIRWSIRKGKEQRKIIKPPSEKVACVAYERRLFTRGFNYYKALTWKILVFWISGDLWEVFAYKKTWSRRWECMLSKAVFIHSHIKLAYKTPFIIRDLTSRTITAAVQAKDAVRVRSAVRSNTVGTTYFLLQN